MEVRSGRHAGRTDVADDLAAKDRLPGRNDRMGHVSVKRLSVVVVSDNDVISITAIPTAVATRHDDRPARGRVNRRTARSTNINRVPSVN